MDLDLILEVVVLLVVHLLGLADRHHRRRHRDPSLAAVALQEGTDSIHKASRPPEKECPVVPAGKAEDLPIPEEPEEEELVDAVCSLLVVGQVHHPLSLV